LRNCSQRSVLINIPFSLAGIICIRGINQLFYLVELTDGFQTPKTTIWEFNSPKTPQLKSEGIPATEKRN
jgi:hypothetical protein